MANNYEDYKPINPQPPRKRKNAALTFVRYAILTLLIVALALSAVFFVASHMSEKGGLKDPTPTLDTDIQTNTPDTADSPDGTKPPEDTTPDEPDVPVIDPMEYIELEVKKSDINKGGLIYVSGLYKVVYPASDELVNLTNVKTSSYKLSASNMKAHKSIIEPMNKMFDDFVKETGNKDIIVWTAYRDEARQQKVYDDYVKEHGEEAAKTAVAKAGESDHNTGLGIAIRVYRDGKSYQLDEVEGYGWIEENCHKYGFVERYPEDKKEITGLDYSSSLYLRYVGVPVAEFMKKNDICLEEFLVQIKEYVFGEAHYYFTTEEGTEYEIYYVNGEAEGETLKISVPKDREYTISGNNMDGFIVAAKK